MHLAAAESPSGIVFLHEVQPGPASRSYGIQVAQRAGIPASVIRHASRELSRLEASGAPTPQLDLFAAPADNANDSGTAVSVDDASLDELHELKARLAAIDPDQLSPREALDLLYGLRADYS